MPKSNDLEQDSEIVEDEIDSSDYSNVKKSWKKIMVLALAVIAIIIVFFVSIYKDGKGG